MPEFELNDNCAEPHPYDALDTFAKGYVEALFFTNGDTGDERENILNEMGTEALAPEAVQDIAKDCAQFQQANAALLSLAYERDGYTEERAGRDFWFTRQHHGVGFWDRKELQAGGLGDRLTLAAHGMGEVYPEIGDDGLIYHN